jgi:hypothetical protein
LAFCIGLSGHRTLLQQVRDALIIDLPPPSGPTLLASADVLRWQARKADTVVQGCRIGQLQEHKIHARLPTGIAWMSVHLLHLQSHPHRIRLGLAVKARHDIERRTRKAMGGRQDPVRGDERSSAEVDTIGLEGHLPRPLARRGCLPPDDALTARCPGTVVRALRATSRRRAELRHCYANQCCGGNSHGA